MPIKRKKSSKSSSFHTFSTTLGNAERWVSLHWNQATKSGTLELGGAKSKPSMAMFLVSDWKSARQGLSAKITIVCTAATARTLSTIKPVKFAKVRGKAKSTVGTEALVESMSAQFMSSIKKAIVGGSNESKFLIPPEQLSGFSMDLTIRVVVLKP